MKYTILLCAFLSLGSIIPANNKTILTTATEFFELFKIIHNNNDLQALLQLITQIETLINTHNLPDNHELIHVLEHLYQYRNQDLFSNTKISTTCTPTTCPFHASYLTNMVSSCLTTNNLIVDDGQAYINGSLCVSGTIDCSNCSAYIFAYDTTTQIPTDSFSDITFNSNGATDSNWTHIPGTADFVAQVTGTYAINTMLFYQEYFIPIATPRFDGIISSIITLDGTEIPGSQSSLWATNRDLSTTNDAQLVNNFLGRSIIVSVNTGQTIRVQHATTTNISGFPAILLAPTGSGITPTSASISIIRIK